ncbi:MAG: HIT family protein [Candidatus Aenigmarchaeota archaeon]|nr:HIT family protein [Candidatus Aenigmarchaeota archaeon]
MEDYSKLDIKEYKYWKIMLHSNQCYLGTTVIWCKRGIIDFFDMSGAEKKEFWKITKKLRNVIIDLFNPDLINYVSLGNVTPHLHFKIMPRYKTKRVFKGFDFIDDRWGKNPSPYNKDFKISEEIMMKLKEEIRKRL